MSLVLGIDPGSRVTGYGLVKADGSRLVYVDSGCIRTAARASLADRLAAIFQGVAQIIAERQPSHVAVERIFMSQGAEAALKLGHARGAAMVAAVSQGVSVHEYEARKVKQAVVGTGAAAKAQVQQMVMRLLCLESAPPEDAADALAVAICHINTSHNLLRLPGEAGGAGQQASFRRGRLARQPEPSGAQP